ncbi:hypothetical protein BC833DRAFT_609570 [Globomyces pollinis-pini]|nr:hypothetical protein BC833DRAFT_609570 [Globomyces pollinis-pini]
MSNNQNPNPDYALDNQLHAVILNSIIRNDQNINQNNIPRKSNKSIAAFINKLYNMVSDQQSDQFIRWADNGKSFVVPNHAEFSKVVLPKFFKHNNFNSFIRQLNIYGFHKVPNIQNGLLSCNEPEMMEFMHPNFMKDAPHLLISVTRKVKDETPVKRETQVDLSNVLLELTQIKKHQAELTSEISKIQKDNQSMWSQSLQLQDQFTRQKDTIDKILSFLASVFSKKKNLAEASKRKRFFLEETSDPETEDEDRNDLFEELNSQNNFLSQLNSGNNIQPQQLASILPNMQGSNPLLTESSASNLKIPQARLTQMNPTSQTTSQAILTQMNNNPQVAQAIVAALNSQNNQNITSQTQNLLSQMNANPQVAQSLLAALNANSNNVNSNNAQAQAFLAQLMNSSFNNNTQPNQDFLSFPNTFPTNSSSQLNVLSDTNSPIKNNNDWKINMEPAPTHPVEPTLAALFSDAPEPINPLEVSNANEKVNDVADQIDMLEDRIYDLGDDISTWGMSQLNKDNIQSTDKDHDALLALIETNNSNNELDSQSIESTPQTQSHKRKKSRLSNVSNDSYSHQSDRIPSPKPDLFLAENNTELDFDEFFNS